MKWLVSKYDRRCPNYHCVGWEQFAAKTSVTEDGKLTRTCQLCGKSETYRLQKFTDRRPCTRCGFVRRVTVSIWTNETEHWSRQCSACDAEERAHVYRQEAHKFEKRALALRVRQDRQARERRKEDG